MKELKKYTEANRKAWNQVMPFHKKAMDEKWDASFSDSKFIFQKEQELDELNKIDIKGKRIAHLSCNNGIELMSLKRMGAAECVGFDICDEAVKDAKTRAEQFNINCEFVRTDVLEIPEKYLNKFDLIYITVGALIWIPDLQAYIKKASDMLITGGYLFIYEHHPFARVFTFDEKKDPLTVDDHYFKNEVETWNDGIDYYGGTEYDSQPTYEFPYTISDLLNNISSSGLCVNVFNEYEKDIALSFERLEKSDLRLPLSYILIARKL